MSRQHLAENPSIILTRIASAVTFSDFKVLLADYLCPALDALPQEQKNDLSVALREAYSKAETLKSIDYEANRTKLEADTKSLEAHVKKHHHGGYETQSEMMMKISLHIARWLSALWKVAVEQGLQLSLVHESLLLCHRIVRRMRATNCRSPLDTANCKLSIVDSNEVTIYSQTAGTVERAILWVWREVLLASLVYESDDVLAKKIIANLERLNLLIECAKTMRSVNVEEMSDTPDGYYDAHWSDAMKASYPALQSLLIASRVKAFEECPTVVLYKSLVHDCPDIRTKLVDLIRERVQKNHGSSAISWAVVAKILDAAAAKDDLFSLIDVLPSSTWNRADICAAQVLIAGRLGMEEDPALRAKGLDILKSGLQKDINDAWSALRTDFGAWDEAFEWLDTQLHTGKLTYKKDAQATDRQRTQRVRLLDQFFEILDRDADSEDEYGDEPWSLISTGFIKHLKAWILALARWPDRYMAMKALDTVQVRQGNYFEADGVIELLAIADVHQPLIECLATLYDLATRPSDEILARPTPSGSGRGPFGLRSIYISDEDSD